MPGKVMSWQTKTNKRGFITYDESNPLDDMIEFLLANHYAAVCSPLHDQDVWTTTQVEQFCADRLPLENVRVTPDDDTYERKIGEMGTNSFGGPQPITELVMVPKPGDLKKPHRHWYVEYDYSIDSKTVLSDFKPLNIVYFERIKSKRAYLRYMCHLDCSALDGEVNKARYKVEDVISLGGVDISCLYTQDDGAKFEQDQRIYDIIREQQIVGYPELIHYLRQNNLRQMYAEVKHNNYFWREELKYRGYDVVTSGGDNLAIAAS